MGLFILGQREQYQIGTRPAQGRRQSTAGLGHGDRKADQCGRHIQLFKAAAHAVLATDRRQPQVQLGRQSTQQGRGGFAPALGHIAQPLEILLERQARLHRVGTHSAQLRQTLRHGVSRAMEGREFGNARDIAVGHGGSIVGLAVANRNLGHHGLLGGHLIGTRKGHQNRRRADGGVEPLGQTLLSADLQPGQVLTECFLQRLALQAGGNQMAVIILQIRLLNHHIGILGYAVGIQERALDVDDLVSAPGHAQHGLPSHYGNRRCLQVLASGRLNKGVHILRRQHHGHALLGFGNGQLGAVQSLVFLRHLVKIHRQAVGQFADGHAHAARTEVVTALNPRGNLRVTEQTLNFALGGWVTLLHLGAAGLDGFHRVGLTGTGGTAAAVTAGGAAQQYDHIALFGIQPDHLILRDGTDHGADLHALGHIAGIVQLGHLAGGQTDLVAVRGITRGCAGGNFAAGQLACQRLIKGQGGVPAAGHTHGLIDISSAGERVANRAAQAGGRTAEGLNLGGVVMGLVLKLDQPGLGLPVDGDGGLDRAGIDLLALVQVIDQPALFQHLGADDGHIHQRNGAVGLTVHLIAAGEVFLQRIFHGRCNIALLHLNGAQAGGKGGMAAVVAPVRINHAQLGHRGIAVFFPAEVIPAEEQILQAHGKAHRIIIALHLLVTPGDKALYPGHIRRHVRLHIQRIGLFHAGHAGFHRVYQIALDFFHLRIREIALYRDHTGRGHTGALALGEQLHALRGRIRALVILAGQILHGKHTVPLGERHILGIHVIHVGFAEDGAAGLFKFLRLQPFHIITIIQTQIGNGRQPQIFSQIGHHVFGFNREAGFLFHKYSDNHILSIPPQKRHPYFCRFPGVFLLSIVS